MLLITSAVCAAAVCVIMRAKWRQFSGPPWSYRHNSSLLFYSMSTINVDIWKIYWCKIEESVCEKLLGLAEIVVKLQLHLHYIRFFP